MTDCAGRRISICKGGEAMGALSGSVDAYGYNGRNEVISSRRTLDGSEVRGFSESFAYDPIGNRIMATEQDETGADHVSRYTANKLNQYVLRSVPGLALARGFAHSNAFVTVNGNEAFRMGEYYFGSDQFDNSTQSGFAELETYAALNCETNDLVSAATNVAFLASATESFIYDDDGNLLEDARFRYFWNGENRMVRAEEKLAPPGREPYVVIYTYDHMGRNVVKDGAKFVWDDYNIIVENVGASNETHNVWGLDLDGTMQGAGGVGGLLAVERNGAVSLPVYDANGNVTEYVGTDGEVLFHCDYSAFGRELIKTGSDDFTHRFSTKPLCRKTGLLEYQLRKYKPWCGRWMNRDAIEEEGGLNLYGYVGNNSKTMYDKNGTLGASSLILSGITSATVIALALKVADCYDKTIGSAGDYGNRDGYAHCVVACNFNNCMGDAVGKIGKISSSIVTMIGAVGWEVVSGWGKDARNDINSGFNGVAGSITGQPCEDACKCEGSNML